MVTNSEEELLVTGAKYYVNRCTPLIKESFLDFAQRFIKQLPEERQKRIKFKNLRPSRKWLEDSFYIEKL